MSEDLALLVEKYAVYIRDLNHLEVETDDMLAARSHIQRLLDDPANAKAAEKYLTQIAELDAALQAQAAVVMHNLGATLRHYRKVRPRPASHWWWYLDKLVQPQHAPRRRKRAVAAV
jgi:hypothetical protein